MYDSGKTIDICSNCHKLAHVLIGMSKNGNWCINLWDKENLIKELRKARKLFTRKAKY